MSIRAIRPILLKRGRGRENRAKTFKNEESAKKWADEQGIKKYTLEYLTNPSAKTQKIRVVY